MRQIFVTQQTMSGGDADGSRDGRFLRNVINYTGDDYELIADCRLGHVKIDDASYDMCHWFRFPLPLNKNPNIDITEARLYFRWNPVENENGVVDANVNQFYPLSVQIAVYPADDAPIPSSASDANNKFDSIDDIVTWSGGQLNYDPGRRIGLIRTDTFAFAEIDILPEISTIRRSGWSLGNDILIFLVPGGYNPLITRYVVFRTWSWIKHQIAQGNLAANAIKTAPLLYIQWEQNTPGSNDGDQHVEDTLIIEQDIAARNTHEYITSTLVIDDTQDITVLHEHNRVLEDELTIIQILGYAKDIFPEYEDVLIFEEDVEYVLDHNADGLTGVVSDILDIEQDIDVNVELNLAVEQTLDIQQDIASSGVISKLVEDNLTIAQDIETIGSTIANPESVVDTLVIEQEISLAGSEYHKGVSGGELEDVLSITQVFTAYVEGTQTFAVCERYDLLYYPSDSANIPEEPTLVPQGSLILEYPTTSPTHTAILPQPLLSNREELNKTRIQRKTRAGTLKTYTDPSWPSTEIFRFKFQDLTNDEKDDLADLIAVSLAKKVRLTDHEGRQWDGLISNPNGEYAQLYRECGHTGEFDFQVIDGPL